MKLHTEVAVTLRLTLQFLASCQTHLCSHRALCIELFPRGLYQELNVNKLNGKFIYSTT